MLQIANSFLISKMARNQSKWEKMECICLNNCVCCFCVIVWHLCGLQKLPPSFLICLPSYYNIYSSSHHNFSYEPYIYTVRYTRYESMSLCVSVEFSGVGYVPTLYALYVRNGAISMKFYNQLQKNQLKIAYIYVI